MHGGIMDHNPVTFVTLPFYVKLGANNVQKTAARDKMFLISLAIPL
jgi:hypothetical protein